MIGVYWSTVVDAGIEQVWAHIRDFNGLPDWHPAFADSHIEDGKASDQVGCVRNFHLQEGGNIRERLLAFSDVDHYCTYAILNSPLPIENYVATIRLRRVADGERTFAEWSATFDVEVDHKEEMETVLTEGVYKTGFDALKQRFGG